MNLYGCIQKRAVIPCLNMYCFNSNNFYIIQIFMRLAQHNRDSPNQKNRHNNNYFGKITHMVSLIQFAECKHICFGNSAEYISISDVSVCYVMHHHTC